MTVDRGCDAVRPLFGGQCPDHDPIDTEERYEMCHVCFMGLCDICATQQQTGTCCCGDDGGTEQGDA